VIVLIFFIELLPNMDSGDPVPHLIQLLVFFFFFGMNKLLFFSLLEYFMFYFCIEFSTFIRAHSTFRLIKLKKTKFLDIRPF
jgi:hypothetical protein